MGVTIRKKGGKWYVFINHNGIRKAKCVGTKAAAEQVKQKIEARLALGDVGILTKKESVPTFKTYQAQWLKTDALRNKPSTVAFYEDYQKRYVLPVFGDMKLQNITRDSVKAFLGTLTQKKLSRNTIRLALASLRIVLSDAVEDGILQVNPALKLGRFTQSHKPTRSAQAMEPEDVERFLKAAKEYAPEYFPLFLIAVRAGLRQGEILGLRWGDFQFGQNDEDPNRYILVERRWYRGKFGTPKGGKTRRIDMSRELRTVLLEMRDERLLPAFAAGKNSIADDLIFPGRREGHPLSERTITDYFLPILERAGLRRFRFHDLRHTFGSLLIEAGAPLPYVRDQMGHSSIQVTADKYVHLLKGRNVRFVDRLDVLGVQPDATPAQPAPKRGHHD